MKQKKTTETGIVLSQETEEKAYHIQVRKSFWTKVRYGSAAVLFTVVFFGLLIGLNVFVGLAGERFQWQADMTQKSLFTVSQATLDYLDGLEHDVELIVLGDENVWRDYSSSASSSSDGGAGVSVHKYIVETLDRYAEASDRISVHYVDPYYNPAFFRDRNQLPVTDDLGDDPVIIVYSPETYRYRFIRTSLFSDSRYIALENRLNTGIRYTTNPDTKKIALITGHGEKSLNYFAAVMEDDGYMVDRLDLPSVEAIPSEYQLLVISDPSRMYSENDIRKIDDFLQNGEELGKSLLVAADLDFCNTDTFLRSYLEEWGIQLLDECIFDPDHSLISLNAVPTFTVRYADVASQMTGTLSSGDYNLRLELGKARGLKRLFEDQNGVYVYPLLTTESTAFSRYQASTKISSAALSAVKKTDSDVSGPFDVGLLSVKTRTSGLDSYSTTVAVFGSASLTDDYFIANPDGANQATQEYVAQLINLMAAQSEDKFEHIQTVSLLTDGLDFQTEGQLIRVFLLTVGAVPLGFLLVGFAVWRKRKYL